MSTATAEKLMTLEEFLAIPEDGRERYLLRGRLVETDQMTRRNRLHAMTESMIVFVLQLWLENQDEPSGMVLSGEAGFILSHDPASSVGIDVAYVSAETLARQSDDTSLIDGPPVLAVEILSPSDRMEDVTDKLEEYLAAGVSLIWVVDPHFRTVTVHRRDAHPVMVNVEGQLTGEPHLPGFSVPVAKLFGEALR